MRTHFDALARVIEDLRVEATVCVMEDEFCGYECVFCGTRMYDNDVIVHAPDCPVTRIEQAFKEVVRERSKVVG